VLETLRGDIGASLMESRIIENKILYLKSIRGGNNELMTEIVKNMRKDKVTAKKGDQSKRKNKKRE